MNFNARQLKALRDLGWTGSSQAEAREFYTNGAGMDDELREGIDAMASDDDAPPASQSKMSDAEIDKKIYERVKQATSEARAEELKRCAAIRDIAKEKKLGDGFAERHIDMSTPIEDVKRFAEELEVVQQEMAPVPGSGMYRVGADLNLSTIGPAMTDAFLMRAGIKLVEADEDGNAQFEDEKTRQAPKLRKPHERSREFMNLRMSDQCRRYLECIKPGCTYGMSDAQVCQTVLNPRSMARISMAAAPGAHGTSDFDNILIDSINASIRAAYVETPPKWPMFASIAFAKSFEQQTEVRMGEFGNPPQVLEGAEYLYGTVGDSKEVWALKKFGELFSLTWEAMLADKFDAFTRIPRQKTQAALRLEDLEAFGVLNDNPDMGDGKALFHADHGNLTTGPGTALSETSLEVGEAAMAEQTGSNSNVKLDIQARILIVHSSKRRTAERLVESPVQVGGDNATPNVLQNEYTVVSSSKLSDKDKWFLSASPNEYDTILVAFLEGMRQPQLEEIMQGSIDGRTWKVRHATKAKARDWRTLYQNDGP